MKNQFLIILLLFLTQQLSAQNCTPNAAYLNSPAGLYPSQLPSGNTGQAYSTQLDIKTATDSSVTFQGIPVQLKIKAMKLLSVVGAPPGFSFTPTYNDLVNNTWQNGGSDPNWTPVQGCIAVSASIASVNTAATGGPLFDGVWPISVYIDAQGKGNPIPATYTWLSTLGTQPYGAAYKYDFVLVIQGGNVPTISSFTPTMICLGNNVNITGANFTGATSVTVGGTPVSSFTVNSSTSITATVGSGTTGLISVVTPTGAATSSSVLTITPQPSTPTITPSGSVTICQGQSVTLTSSAASSYVWSNGQQMQSITVSPTQTTSYTVTVGSGNCTATSQAVTVVVNSSLPTPAITPSGSVTICQGESVTLTSSSASSYVWSNGQQTQSITVTPTQTTSYTVTVGSGNCTATSQAITVVVGAAPVVTNQPQNQLSSLGQTAQFVATTSTPSVNYQWQSDVGLGFQNLSNAGQYSGVNTNTLLVSSITTNNDNQAFRCVISAGGCSINSNSAMLSVCSLGITSQPQSQTVNLSTNATFSVSGTNIQTYQWQSDLGFGYQNLSNAGQYSGVNTNTLTLSNATTANNGQAFRCAVSLDGCSDTTTIALLTVNNNVGISEASIPTFSIFPNPANENITISLAKPANNVTLEVYDIYGKLIMTDVGKSGKQFDLNTSALAPGAYMIKLMMENKFSNRTLIKL
jgi:hypothetical protein